MPTDSIVEFEPLYSPWRHGGWYVENIRYPSGACGCVSRHYDDLKWRIVCHPFGYDMAPTFQSRDDAARGEFEMVRMAKRFVSLIPDGMTAGEAARLTIDERDRLLDVGVWWSTCDAAWEIALAHLRRTGR